MDIRLWGVGALFLLGTACTVGDTVDLEECAGNADVDDVTTIGWLYADSQHELIACGQLTTRFVIAAIESVAVIAGDPASANLLEGMADEQEKELWMLRAFLAA